MLVLWFTIVKYYYYLTGWFFFEQFFFVFFKKNENESLAPLKTKNNLFFSAVVFKLGNL